MNHNIKDIDVIEILFAVVIILLLINIWLTFKKSGQNLSQFLTDISKAINVFDKSLEKVDKSIGDDFQRNREESGKIAK